MNRVTPPEGSIGAYAASGEVDFFTSGMRIIDDGFFYSLKPLSGRLNDWMSCVEVTYFMCATILAFTDAAIVRRHQPIDYPRNFLA
jgi:hypothetical protein